MSISQAAPAVVAATGDAATPSERPGLGPCLQRLGEAIDAARILGLATADAEAVRDEATQRLGFPADTYVLALVGGTGVGKSSLLNALAGAAVSQASARRPTTQAPVAWIPRAARDDLVPLLDWLQIGAADVREHDEPALGDVAIVDLPDLDSIEPDHRRRVEAALPRVDAVVWVTDPEKYHDAVLHDDFLRRWIPRLDRQVIVLNKVDRLGADDAQRIRRDLQRELDSEANAGASKRPRVVLAAAAPAGYAYGIAANRPDVAELRAWLSEGVEAKAVVMARLAASIRAAISTLAATAGVPGDVRPEPILGASARRAAIGGATNELLRVVDLANLEGQAVAATRARARARGTGPLGFITSRIYRYSGRESRVADPARFLGRWRERGTLAPATEAVRAALTEPLRIATPSLRPAIAASADPSGLEPGLAAAVDRAVASRGGDVPTSRAWPVIGMLQTIVTIALALAAAWVVLWILIRFPVDSVQIPILGQVPVPLVFLVVAILAGYLIARVLGLHAGLVGRRWARRLETDLRAGVTREVEATAFTDLDRLDVARTAIWAAANGAKHDCG
jgi:energy-coupling factor transporter ATP-binding protein EcfA2